MICAREKVDAWIITPTVQTDPATDIVLGRPSLSPTARQERAPRAEPSSKTATTRPWVVRQSQDIIMTIYEGATDLVLWHYEPFGRLWY